MVSANTIRNSELLKNILRSTVSSKMETFRTGKQCRERYLNHLKPDIRKDPWTEEEDELLIHLFQTHGSCWSKFMPYLPGRSDNSIKNRFHVLERNSGGTIRTGSGTTISRSGTAALRNPTTKFTPFSTTLTALSDQHPRLSSINPAVPITPLKNPTILEGNNENDTDEGDTKTGEDTPSKRMRHVAIDNGTVSAPSSATNTPTVDSSIPTSKAKGKKKSKGSWKGTKDTGKGNKQTPAMNSSPKITASALSTGSAALLFPLNATPTVSNLTFPSQCYGQNMTPVQSALPPLSTLSLQKTVSFDRLHEDQSPAVTIITPVTATEAAGFTATSDGINSSTFGNATRSQLLAQVIPVLPLPTVSHLKSHTKVDNTGDKVTQDGQKDLKAAPSAAPVEPVQDSLFNMVVKGKPYQPQSTVSDPSKEAVDNAKSKCEVKRFGRKSQPLSLQQAVQGQRQLQQQQIPPIPHTESLDNSWDFNSGLDDEENIDKMLMFVEEELSKSRDNALADTSTAYQTNGMIDDDDLDLFTSLSPSFASTSLEVSPQHDMHSMKVLPSNKKRTLSISAVPRPEIKKTAGRDEDDAIAHFRRCIAGTTRSRERDCDSEPLNDMLWDMDGIEEGDEARYHDEEREQDDDFSLAFVYNDSRMISGEGIKGGRFRHSFSSFTDSSDGCELLSPIIRLLQRGSIDSLCLSVDNNSYLLPDDSVDRDNEQERDRDTEREVEEQRLGIISTLNGIQVRRPSLLFNSHSRSFDSNTMNRTGSGLLPDVITNDYPTSTMSMAPSVLSPTTVAMTPIVVPPVPTVANADEVGINGERMNSMSSSFVFPCYSPVFPSSFLCSLASPSFTAAVASSSFDTTMPTFGRTSFPSAAIGMDRGTTGGYSSDLLSTYFRIPAAQAIDATANTVSMSLSGSTSAELNGHHNTAPSVGNRPSLAAALPGIVAVPSYDPLPSPSQATGLRRSFSVPLFSSSTDTVDLSDHAMMTMDVEVNESQRHRTVGLTRGAVAKALHKEREILKKKGPLTMRDIEQARWTAVQTVEHALRGKSFTK